MKKIKIRTYHIYEIKKEELIVFQYYNLFGNQCDDCNSSLESKDKIYYIPVLNRGLCENCYKEWISNASYYKDDQKYITNGERWIEKMANQLKIPIVNVNLHENYKE